MIRALALFIGAGLATGAVAQEKITPQAFLERATGNTLTFTDLGSGQVVGVEQFLSRTLSVWAQSNGRCAYGDISIRGEQLCFLYRDAPDPNNCWLPFEAEGQLMVLSTDTYQAQTVTEISQSPVLCQAAPLS